MTTINLTLKRGDSKTLAFQVLDADGEVVDIVDAVVKFAVKLDNSLPNHRALIFKTSYDEKQIFLSDPENGRFAIYLIKQDTVHADPAKYEYDVEVTRKGDAVPLAGTVEVGGPNPRRIRGTGTSFRKLSVGDLVQLASAIPENSKLVNVTRVLSDTVVETDYEGWVAEAGLAIEGWVGNVKTPVSGLVFLDVDTTT